MARCIAAKSPLAVRGTKAVLNHGRDHSIEDGLAFVANWNASALLSRDMQLAAEAIGAGRAPAFDD